MLNWYSFNNPCNFSRPHVINCLLPPINSHLPFQLAAYVISFTFSETT